MYTNTGASHTDIELSIGTIMHLQARKQRHKLKIFQKLWRTLVVAGIAVAAFFVVSSLSLSNRLDEGT
jgi:hypothetical protein